MKKVLYTCITGGYDNIPQYECISPDWDYILFTDNPELIKAGKIYHWSVRPLAYSDSDNVRNARWHKANPHILFPEYDYSMWLDGNISVARQRAYDIANEFISQNVLVAVPIHTARTCIYQEANVIIDKKIDYRQTVQAQMRLLRHKKYPKNNGLSETNILLRQHNQIISTSNMWWHMIHQYSKRDQLSFDYVMWANNIKTVPFYNDNGAGMHRYCGDFIFKYIPEHNQDKIKTHKFKLFEKIKLANGRRHIYFCGIKIFSYKKHHNSNNCLIRGKGYCVHGVNNSISVIQNGQKTQLSDKLRIKGLDIRISGNNNTVILEMPIKATQSRINIENDNTHIEIGTSPNLSLLNIDCKLGNGQICKIGSGTTVYGANIKMTENSKCYIGTDCMLSNSINIWAADGHSVLDCKSSQILNQANSAVIIGNHVWIGEAVRILKKAHIYDNSIVAGGAVCCKDYKEANVIIGGNPGKIIKRNITWHRQNPYMLNLSRQTEVNKIPHIDKVALDTEIKNFKNIGINTNQQNNPRIIVSLTSIPDRMSDLHYTLYSLLCQTKKPDMVILWLGEDKFPNKEQDLSESILALCKNGLTIKWCRDIRSYTKLVPALKEFPEDIIITVDDDIYYSQNLVKTLYDEYLVHPNMVHCIRAHKITKGKSGKILPYNEWEHEIQNTEPSCDNFLTGVGGVLYPPHSLYKEVFNEQLFKKLAPTADDIWFWAMAVKNGTKINVVNSNFRLTYVNPERELRLTADKTLASENVCNNKNDVQMSDTINYLGIDL